jgi:hypothetical protein
MNQRIIYLNNEGGVSIIVPAFECGLTIEQIAAKDVPAGKPYKIVDVTDIPSDRTFRAAWTVDEEDLTDGVGSEHNIFVTDPQHPNYVAPVSEEQE